MPIGSASIGDAQIGQLSPWSIGSIVLRQYGHFKMASSKFLFHFNFFKT
jgi:hypothetical protein